MTPDPLLLQFATDHPAEVAKLMVDFPVTDVVALIGSLPPHLAAQVSARLASRQLSEALGAMEHRQLGTLLVTGRPADVMALVAHMTSELKEQLIAEASASDQALLRRLFHAPLKTLAGIATPDFVRINASRLCRDVRAELVANESDSENPLFVINDKGMFLGVASPLMLLQKKFEEMPISAIVQPVEALSGQIPVAAAIAAPQWRQFRALPVVDNQSQIIGAITFEQLFNEHEEAGDDAAGLEALIGQVATSYFEVCANLMELAVGGPRNDPE